jgi:hypothetical protein
VLEFPERIRAFTEDNASRLFFYDNQAMFYAKSSVRAAAISSNEKFFLSEGRNYFAKM